MDEIKVKKENVLKFKKELKEAYEDQHSLDSLVTGKQLVLMLGKLMDAFAPEAFEKEKKDSALRRLLDSLAYSAAQPISTSEMIDKDIELKRQQIIDLAKRKVNEIANQDRWYNVAREMFKQKLDEM